MTTPPGTSEIHYYPVGTGLGYLCLGAVLSFRRDVTPSALFLFAGTRFLAAALIVCVVVVAAVLPYISLHL